ncbi:hypothetical protein, partial [Staphylococcus epidermidis]|uniref:hypothetical protein n=1 Tax=Staphylococcus epidermidis TaxID=1282 RepID=UPI001C92BD19
ISNITKQLHTPKPDPTTTFPNTNPSLQQLTHPLNKINTLQPKLNQPIPLLQPKQNNSQLLQTKKPLQHPLNDIPQTQPITQQTINNYNHKQPQPQTPLTSAQTLIHNP